MSTYDAINDYWLDWIKTAKVGDQVECIIAGVLACKGYRFFFFERHREFGSNLVKGKIYTITSIGIETEVVTPATAIKVNGAAFDGFPEIGFPVRWFRPVIHRPTSISIFTDMLKTAPAPIGETV